MLNSIFRYSLKKYGVDSTAVIILLRRPSFQELSAFVVTMLSMRKSFVRYFEKKRRYFSASFSVKRVFFDKKE